MHIVLLVRLVVNPGFNAVQNCWRLLAPPVAALNPQYTAGRLLNIVPTRSTCPCTLILPSNQALINLVTGSHVIRKMCHWQSSTLPPLGSMLTGPAISEPCVIFPFAWMLI